MTNAYSDNREHLKDLTANDLKAFAKVMEHFSFEANAYFKSLGNMVDNNAIDFSDPKTQVEACKAIHSSILMETLINDRRITSLRLARSIRDEYKAQVQDFTDITYKNLKKHGFYCP